MDRRSNLTRGQGIGSWFRVDACLRMLIELRTGVDNTRQVITVIFDRHLPHTATSSPTPGKAIPLKIRSMVGLIPLFAVVVLKPEHLRRLPNFAKRTIFCRACIDLHAHVQPTCTPAFVLHVGCTLPTRCTLHPAPIRHQPFTQYVQRLVTDDPTVHSCVLCVCNVLYLCEQAPNGFWTIART